MRIGKRAAGDAEGHGGARLIPLVLLERREDEVPFNLFERDAFIGQLKAHVACALLAVAQPVRPTGGLITS
jgi:hypothetical protein